MSTRPWSLFFKGLLVWVLGALVNAIFRAMSVGGLLLELSRLVVITGVVIILVGIVRAIVVIIRRRNSEKA